jgi:hypothetical protein
MHCVIESNDTRFFQYWNMLYANDPVQNPMYLQMQRRHERSHSKLEYKDRSFLVMAADEPVFACSLTSHVDEHGRKCVGYFGAEASSHVNQSSLQTPSNNFEPESIRLLQQHINQLIEEIQPDSLDYLDPVSHGIMSPVTQLLLQRGAVPTVQSAQIIDLTQSQEALYSNMNEDCRSRVDWGLRSLSIDIVSGRRFNKLKQTEVDRLFVESKGNDSNTILHNKRVYESLIREGMGFLIQARYQGELVSSSLFVHTEKTAHFVFGDILPAAPQKPVMNALIWQGILHSKAKGCERFDFGCSAFAGASKSKQTQERSQSTQYGGKPQARLKVSLDRLTN